MNHRDPTGMYQADVHYGLTYFLALRAGFSDAQARVIATGAESPDQDPERDPIKTTVRAITNAALGLVMHGPRGAQRRGQEGELRGRLRRDHFPRSDGNAGVVEPFSQESQQRLMAAMKTGSIVEFGEGLHTLQDSVSHRGKPSLFDMSGHPSERGGWTSKDTDIPSIYPREASSAAQATFNYLVAFRNARGRSASSPSWSQIEQEVNQFIALSERGDKKAWLRARGVTMPETYWDDVSVGPKEWARMNHAETVTIPPHKSAIDPKTSAAMARAQEQCRCAPGF